MLMPARITHHAFGSQNFGSKQEIKNNINNEKDPKTINDIDDNSLFVVWHPMSEDVAASGKLDKNKTLRTKLFVPRKKSLYFNNVPVELVDDSLNVIEQDFYVLPTTGVWKLFLLADVSATSGSSTSSLGYCGCIAKSKPNGVTSNQVLSEFLLIRVDKNEKYQYLSGTFSFYTLTDGVFALSESENNGATQYSISNNYYQVCGKTFKKSVSSISPQNGILSLEVPVSDPGSAVFRQYEDMSYLSDAQEDLSTYIIPLYEFENGVLTVDLRGMPTIGSIEPIAAVS